MKSLRYLFLALALIPIGANAAITGDVNGDGTVNISDVNVLISMILAGDNGSIGDVNGDGTVNISDLNDVIGIILGGGQHEEQPARLVGGDISMLTKYEAHYQMARDRYHISNVGYYDNSGKRIDDLITWVKQQGWNAARVRLFVNPANASNEHMEQGVIQNLDTVKVLGRRIKAAGMKFMLDFHYSDTWADPAKQWTPSDWLSMSNDQLYTKIYEYTKDCLEQMNAAGASPDFIQTGNEISYGMMWGAKGSSANRCYMGSEANWPRFTTLLKQAGKACREVCPQAQIIIHIERVAQPNVIVNFYNQMKNKGVDYDIIGLSYYPYFHGNLNALETALNTVENTFDKPIQIVETGYPSKYAIGGSTYDYTSTYPYSQEGQRKFTEDLITLLKNHPRVNGLSWWYPEANAKGCTGDLNTNWYNAGLFNNENGRALKAFYEMKNFK